MLASIKRVSLIAGVVASLDRSQTRAEKFALFGSVCPLRYTSKRHSKPHAMTAVLTRMPAEGARGCPCWSTPNAAAVGGEPDDLDVTHDWERRKCTVSQEAEEKPEEVRTDATVARPRPTRRRVTSAASSASVGGAKPSSTKGAPCRRLPPDDSASQLHRRRVRQLQRRHHGEATKRAAKHLAGRHESTAVHAETAKRPFIRVSRLAHRDGDICQGDNVCHLPQTQSQFVQPQRKHYDSIDQQDSDVICRTEREEIRVPYQYRNKLNGITSLAASEGGGGCA